MHPAFSKEGRRKSAGWGANFPQASIYGKGCAACKYEGKEKDIEGKRGTRRGACPAVPARRES